MKILEKILELLAWLAGKADEKKLDDERHTLSRLREAERKAEESDDTSGVESILRE